MLIPNLPKRYKRVVLLYRAWCHGGSQAFNLLIEVHYTMEVQDSPEKDMYDGQMTLYIYISEDINTIQQLRAQHEEAGIEMSICLLGQDTVE